MGVGADGRNRRRQMLFQQASFDPREFVRRFRENYVNFYKLSKTVGTPGGVEVRTPQEAPLSEGDLPVAVRELLDGFRRENPGTAIRLLRHLRTVNGRPVSVVEDDSDLPTEDRFLSVSQTVTLNTARTVRVVTDLFVASIDERADQPREPPREAARSNLKPR
jgi:hypothetical protein